MLSKIMMPPGGQTTNESIITKWHKKVGDSINRGDVLFEIETDKATLEIESYAEGVLKVIYLGEGEKASVGQIVAYVGNTEDNLPIEETTDKYSDVSTTIDDDDYAPIMANRQNTKTTNIQQQNILTNDNLLKASPKARKLAKENSIDINSIFKETGTKVKNEDILNFINREIKPLETEDYYFIDTTPMRRAIASKMVESITTGAQYTVSMDMNMTKAIEFRKNLNEYAKENVKISFNDIIVKCVAKAIKKYPLINGVYGDKSIKINNIINFGLAVSIDGGLVVPVIKNVGGKTLSEIAVDSNITINAIKSGNLDKKLMSGGTITLSNLGMLGVKHFTAILNPPESCILAVGSIEEKVVLENGNIKATHNMNITATFDHRLIDGAYGAEFLKEVKAILEKPELLAY
jgi:pyruvate dehydrogenase E2 component (dihydrolipoamide acetyltransferase)